MNPRREAFDGRVAIVTGASAGIGAATARALAAAGAHVVLCARRVERLEQLAAQLSAAHGVEAHALPVDMSSREQIESLVAEVLRGYDRIDILINNAGVGLQGDAAVLPEKELRYLFDVNVYGPLWAMQAVVPTMRRRQGGAIANISSILAKAPLPSLGMTGGSSGYTGSKAALHAISLAARMELSADGINVVTVLPGVTRSEFNDRFLVSGSPPHPPSAGDETGAARPRGSLMGVTPPERVAEAILRGIERDQREVYVTAKDRLFVLGANALPGLFEWAMIRLRRQRLARGETS